MKEKEYIVCGYRFHDIEEYKRAQGEVENINYIRNNTDLTNIKNVIKLYHKLFEKNTFQTVAGYEFLKELRTKIEKSGLISENDIPPITIKSGAYKEDNLAKEKEQIKLQECKAQLRNAKIVIGFCILIIIGIFLMTFSSKMDKVKESQSLKLAEASYEFTIPT